MGHTSGTYNVGCYYKKGIGVAKDEHQAIAYHNKGFIINLFRINVYLLVSGYVNKYIF